MPQGPEMTQWIRTLAVLKEDPAAAGSYTYLSVTPISGGSHAIFWLCMYCICSHMIHRLSVHTFRHTFRKNPNIHKSKNLKISQNIVI